MQAAIYSSASHFSKAFQAFSASSACAANASSYHSCSVAPLQWPSGFSWGAPFSNSGRSLSAFGSNSALKPTAYGGGLPGPLGIAGRPSVLRCTLDHEHNR
ncbi:DUF1010 domain-containing protein [Alicycliphilus denitrificans]|uniref:DUF1010 domain-containing protein n=1 Tax=Alicycliphilus denitrificans TaxID=179636 RepID=UPI001F258C1D|nr:DUF1010 domain-containing protein [Alicycliphilus denitrificans]